MVQGEKEGIAMQINPLLSEMDCRINRNNASAQMESLRLRRLAESEAESERPKGCLLSQIRHLIEALKDLVPSAGYVEGVEPYPLEPKAS
jgi:hypothetical protein